MTAAEAAAYCRLTLASFYNVRKHIRRAVGVRKLLFRREDLDHFLQTRRRTR